MKTCPTCHASVSPGASDCAVCGQLFVLAGNSTPLRERYPLLVAAALGALVSAWVLFASTWLFWIPLPALCISLVFGWAVSRGQQSSRALVVMFTVPCFVVVSFWAFADIDPKFGNLLHLLATLHAALVLFVFWASRWVRRQIGITQVTPTK